MTDRPGFGGLREALLEILDDALRIGPARCGNVQVLNPDAGALEIVAGRGFSEAFLQRFRQVRREDPCACARAWRLQRRVSIPSVALDLAFTPYLQDAREAGFAAVQSTPAITPAGVVVGVLSTHYAECGQPSSAEGILLDHHAGRVAAAIERFLQPATTAVA